MTPAIETCPHCGAPLTITRFAAIVVCSFCDATVRIDPSSVSASRFRQAWEEWNATPAVGHARRISIGDTHWIEQSLLAGGEISDVYLAKRARWPSELALVKILRDSGDAALLEHEWRALKQLHASAAASHIDVGFRVPAPVVKDNLACAYRWAAGFLHTFENVRASHPDGVPPVAAIWAWRRILEVLGVMHNEGLVHGAVLPNHLLIQDGEHGVRIVGFSCADASNSPLRVVSSDFESYYPDSILDSRRLSPAMDVAMSARAVAYLLGARAGELPAHVPLPLAELLQRTGAGDAHANIDPWKLHKQVGELGKTLFGPPAFHPIVMT